MLLDTLASQRFERTAACFVGRGDNTAEETGLPALDLFPRWPLSGHFISVFESVRSGSVSGPGIRGFASSFVGDFCRLLNA